jgi:hypothetical protein
MERRGLHRAVKLLEKARSTDSDAEAAALVLHSYRLLAQVITQYDLECGETEFGPHRRERRLIADRRASRAAAVDPEPVHASYAARYQATEALTRPEQPRVNLHL